jgi:hypothetical protein
VTSANYHVGRPVTANGFTATPYILNDGVESPGLLLRNRPDFSRSYNGLELALVKRLSNRWMGRAAFTLNNWKEQVGPGAMINPTHQDLDPQIDGAQHVEFAVGSGKNYYTSAKWQVNLNGMYQMPGGFEIAANLFGTPGLSEAGLSPGGHGSARRRAERAGRQHDGPDPAEESLGPRPAPGQEPALRQAQT